jgi:hypothetical protein
MTAVHDVLRYLLERVTHSTQDDHDRVAAVIDEDENAALATSEDENVAPAVEEEQS